MSFFTLPPHFAPIVVASRRVRFVLLCALSFLALQACGSCGEGSAPVTMDRSEAGNLVMYNEFDGGRQRFPMRGPIPTLLRAAEAGPPQ